MNRVAGLLAYSFLATAGLTAAASAQLATGPSPYAGAKPRLSGPFEPCGAGPLAGVSIMGRDAGTVDEERPDVEFPGPSAAPGPVPASRTRSGWTYLRAYSRKPGDLFAVCRLPDGTRRTVALPVGTVSCERVGSALSCR